MCESVPGRSNDGMLDLTFYKEAVLEIILCKQHIPREVYELRLSLFLRASHHYFEVIKPFPSQFFDPITKTHRYDRLLACIATFPDLRKIDDTIELPEETWQLLHWIFTNPLQIEVFKESEISEHLTNVVREETKLFSIPYPIKLNASLSNEGCIRFQITHPIEINSTRVFLTHKAKFGSFYAYHGSPAHNFHSIIHRGLRCSLNKRSSYGKGTYLSSDIHTARAYSKKHGFHNKIDKICLKNPAGITFCVAIVEVIKHPSIKVVNFSGREEETLEQPNFEDTSSNQKRYYVVDSDELMRLKHLLAYY